MSGNTEAPNDAAETGPAVESPDHEAEAAKWRELARKWEGRAKENKNAAKELEELRASQLSDQERAVEAARKEGADAVRAEFADKLARTAFLAAARSRVADPETLLSRVNVASFLGEDGEPDEKAIGEFLDSVAPKPAEQSPDVFGQIQGARATDHTPLNGDPILAKVNAMLGIHR